MKLKKMIVPYIVREFLSSVGFFPPYIPKPSVSLIYDDQDIFQFQMCLELTKHNIWISMEGGRLL